MSIYKQLFEAKKEIGKLTKDAKNPFFKSNYLSLNGLIDAVEEVLVNHNLILLQPIIDGYVVTTIINIDEPLEVVSSKIALPNIQDPQKLGSAITYYRRYTLQSLLGLQAEDDDANVATKHVNKPIPTPKRLTAAQVKVIPQAEDIAKLRTVLKSYTLQPNEKLMIDKRIAELTK